MCGRPRKVEKTVPEYAPNDVALQRQAILEDDLDHDDAEDVDNLLAEQHQMQCSKWERHKTQTLSSSVQKS